MEWLNSLKETLGNMGRGGPDTSEKRKTYRVSCSLPVMVQLNDNEALSGRLTNLSTTGLKLKFPKTLKPGVDYTMTLRGKPGPGGTPARELTLQGRCIWSRRSAQGEGYDVGCLFIGFVGVHMNQVLDFFRAELQLDLVDSEQKRRNTRIYKRFNVTYTGPDGRVYNGFIRNLSQTGMQIASRSPVDNGTELSITVDFAAKGEKLHTVVHVVRCRKVPREDWYEVGARFQSLSERDQQRLGTLVAAFMREDWAAS